MDKEIVKMAEQIKALSNVAVLQYTNIVNDILDEKITDEQELERDVMNKIIHTLEYKDFVNSIIQKNKKAQ